MIQFKAPGEIEIMAEGGKILAGIMKRLESEVKPGISTQELDRLAEELVLAYGKCSFKGYQGFPSCLCVSVNEEIVHGLPSGRILKEGDIVSLDLGIFYKGFHTDMAVTLPIGKISLEAENLIKVTKNALEKGIEAVKIGKTFGDIGAAIQKYVERQGYNVVRELCGHGIGSRLHEDPQVLNYGKEGIGLAIKQGMVFCIEPMVTLGDWHLKKAGDGFGFLTKDGSLSCHFEHTAAVTEKGCLLLTAIV